MQSQQQSPPVVPRVAQATACIAAPAAPLALSAAPVLLSAQHGPLQGRAAVAAPVLQRRARQAALRSTMAAAQDRWAI